MSARRPPVRRPIRAAALAALAVLAFLAGGALPAVALDEETRPAPTLKVIRGPAAGPDPSTAPGERLVWNELDPALAEARRAQKPLLVDVYTDWCGWCKRMDKTTYADPDVRDYVQGAFVPARVNAEDDKRKASYLGKTRTYRQFADTFRISGYPTTLFLAPDGQLITQLPGYVKPGAFLTVLRYVAEGHYRTQSWESFTRDGESEGP
jgi:thioredoxin-related protein